MSAAHKLSTPADIRARRIRLGCDWLKQTRHLVSLGGPTGQAAEVRRTGFMVPVSAPPSPLPPIPANAFEWAHSLADEFGGSPEGLGRLRERALWREIIAYVCIKTEVTIERLKSNRRHADIVRARHIAYWTLYNFTKDSLPAIGLKMGGRDHTTILHGRRRIEAEIEEYGLDIGKTWHEAVDALAAHIVSHKRRCRDVIQ